MTQYTVIDDKGIKLILAQYGMDNLVSYKVLSGGSENTNYFVKTLSQSFVLTVCEQKSLKNTTELANLLIYLKQNNFNTSELIKTTNGNLTTQINQKPVMLKRYIEGDIIEDLDENILMYLGKQLSALHLINPPNYLPKSLSYGIDKFDGLQKVAADSSFYIWLKKTQSYLLKHINSDLPKALIHSDIFYNNIIVNQENQYATIMDFEEACYYYRIFDIGMMIIGTCRSKDNINIDIQKASMLLSGYQDNIKLLTAETKSLKAFTAYAAAATGFWRFKNFNYVNVIPEMKNHYLEMQLLADNIMKLPDEIFIKYN